MRSSLNLSRKILVVHAEPHARRRLALVLVEAGYDVRPFSSSETALQAAQGEWFDLALIDYALPGGEGFGFAGSLRQAQPTLPVIMLLPQLELPLIIQGIRQGLTDVLASEEDPRPVLRRVHALLRPGVAFSPEPTPADLAEVEALLARYEPSRAGDGAESTPNALDVLREQLAEATRVRGDLEARLAKVEAEKHAAEAQLQAVLGQQHDTMRVQAELAELQMQRDLAEQLHRSTEAEARELNQTKAVIAAERQALEVVKREIVNSQTPFPPERHPLALEKAHLEAVREDLREEEARVREEATRVRQETAQLAIERRKWHEELEQLREREENLRFYEQRLREQQAQLEAERVAIAGGNPRPSGNPAPAAPGKPGADGGKLDPFVQRDLKLRAEWERVHRANELLEAERAVFRDERMALRDLEQTIRSREERLREVEAQLAAHEVIRQHMPIRGTVRPGPRDAEPADASGGMLKAIARAPFSLWGKGGQ